jgi:dTDP-4-dehydrorhamnose reductase
MKTVLLLGNTGMLGDAVSKYFNTDPEYKILTITERWPSQKFKNVVQTLKPDFIINCIGKIPQRKPSYEEYAETNIALPLFLDTLGSKVIHPSTDCEFSGHLPTDDAYTKSSVRDAQDTYGMSKAVASQQLEENGVNTKIIRTSIVGHEVSASVSLLDWFLTSEGTVRGYTNHFWNGITTLAWAERAKALMDAWDDFPTLNQYGVLPYINKLEVLETMRATYQKDIEIVAFETPETTNKCLVSDIPMPSLADQLQALRTFYSR